MGGRGGEGGREEEIERERKIYARTLRRGERKICTRKNFNTLKIGCESFIIGSLVGLGRI